MENRSHCAIKKNLSIKVYGGQYTIFAFLYFLFLESLITFLIEFTDLKSPNIFQFAIKNILFVINLNLIYRFVFYRSIKLKLNAK